MTAPGASPRARRGRGVGHYVGQSVASSPARKSIGVRQGRRASSRFCGRAACARTRNPSTCRCPRLPHFACAAALGAATPPSPVRAKAQGKKEGEEEMEGRKKEIERKGERTT
ncbi:hypothetical protein R5R35_002949 [Gryllus longicercus]|uniref:Uncharacterized protein n=1 Tax=Gryllus longicercus TaxID=2509291 RepID=A0AAN9VXH1_9ORTH